MSHYPSEFDPFFLSIWTSLSVWTLLQIPQTPGGHWPWKGVWGCTAQKTPFSHLSCSSQGSHFKQKSLKVSSQDPLLRKKNEKFSLYSLSFYQNFSSWAPKFENFCSQDPSFKGKNQFASPSLWKSGPHTPTWKKVECPPQVQTTESHSFQNVNIPIPPVSILQMNHTLA